MPVPAGLWSGTASCKFASSSPNPFQTIYEAIGVFFFLNLTLRTNIYIQWYVKWQLHNNRQYFPDLLFLVRFCAVGCMPVSGSPKRVELRHEKYMTGQCPFQHYAGAGLRSRCCHCYSFCRERLEVLCEFSKERLRCLGILQGAGGEGWVGSTDQLGHCCCPCRLVVGDSGSLWRVRMSLR